MNFLVMSTTVLDGGRLIGTELMICGKPFCIFNDPADPDLRGLRHGHFVDPIDRAFSRHWEGPFSYEWVVAQPREATPVPDRSNCPKCPPGLSSHAHNIAAYLADTGRLKAGVGVSEVARIIDDRAWES